MPLLPAQLQQLYEALRSAFTKKELTRMLRFELGKRLSDLVEEDSFENMVFDLLDLTERQGWTEDLVRGAYKRNPGNAALRRFCYQHMPSAVSPPPVPEELAQAAQDGINAVVQGMDRPKVRQAVVKYRARFQTARTTIDVLVRYKALHDGLHTLQFQYLERLEVGQDTFQSDDGMYDELDQCRERLAALGQELRRQAQSLPTWQLEEKWLGLFDQAVDWLQQALRVRDVVPLRDCVKQCRRLLSSQPPRINCLLVSASRDLQLPALIQALEEVYVAGDLPAPDGFVFGLDGLRRIQSGLAGLVEQHTTWQQIDIDLRFAVSSTEQGLDDLLLLWEKNVKPAVTELSVVANPDWAQELHRRGKSFEEAAAAQDLGKSREALRSFHRQAMKQFFEVDRELKKLCAQLPAIGEPLEALLRNMSHAGD